MTDLKGTTAVVTGGTSGIGLATAQALICRGANVVVNARRPNEEVLGALGAIRPAPGRRHLRRRRCESCPRPAGASPTTAMEAFGRLDTVVHSAGGPAPGTILELTPESVDRRRSLST